MPNVVKIKFEEFGKCFDFDARSLELNRGEAVIVETEQGTDVGWVVAHPKSIAEEDLKRPLKAIIRKATQEEVDRYRQIRSKERDAFQSCLQKIKTRELPMKLVDVRFSFDGSKIVFYFTSESRVDFRDLVRDLVKEFRTRIEVRQIGVRDQAKRMGGLGTCGRMLCCRAFLDEFEPVSIRMAKEQSLSLNPGKISGLCGRLMCCLSYEYEAYEESKRVLPKVGSKVKTPKGPGVVRQLKVLQGRVAVELESGREMEFPADQLPLMGELGGK
ncbi:MAG: stage 0 sporulation family protein [candidate division NC10 bacterium]|nr:stage 0 sporulation family protein [candidate division NC10 bacterium]